MENIDPREHRRVDRRTFVKGALATGGLLAGAGVGIKALADNGSGAAPIAAQAPTPATPTVAASGAGRKPNILVILVDQLRYPQWFSAGRLGIGLPPNLRRLREGAVSFARHYTASNDCTPSRSALLTGLYTHQTGCMITGGSTLDPGFPTWGTMLREHGYHTRWFGKWHLTHRDNHWTPASGERALERYGFAGGFYPSPDGGPGQGWQVDPEIAVGSSRSGSPTRATASRGARPCRSSTRTTSRGGTAWSDRVPSETSARRTVRRLPPNFETPELLFDRHKPRLQHSFQQTAAASFGPVPFTGPESTRQWLAFLDLYAKLQREVDRHIGTCMRALHSRPEVAANTVIVFTSDHGEYGASHGLRGKGASAYEEAIRVPLFVKDNRRLITSAPAKARAQLSSSVDIAPMLLSIATGSSQWRREPHYSHIAERLDLARILEDPAAPGRDFVLHATDEVVTEFAIAPYAADAPLHIVALRTAGAKYAAYSHWPEEGITPLAAGEENELYDYSTHSGRLELHNSAGSSPLESKLRADLARAFHRELRAPLPSRLGEAHARGFADYFSTARKAAESATARRRMREEHEDLTREKAPEAHGNVSSRTSRAPKSR